MQTWENIDSWMCVIPPSRPQSSQLQRIEAWLKKCSQSAAIGILGSTPEFIDLLVSLGFRNITVFEKFPVTYQRMKAFRSFDAIENVVWGDWIETLAQRPATFDVLLSDLTSGNIPYSLRRQFYAAVRTALTSTGSFIDRVLVGRNQPFEHDQHIETFSKEPINLLTANRFNCEVFFLSTLSSPSGVIDTTAFYEYIQERHPDRRLIKLLDLVKKVTPPGCIWWYGKPWTELAPEYFLGFNVTETHPEPKCSWYFDAAYTFFLNLKE